VKNKRQNIYYSVSNYNNDDDYYILNTKVSKNRYGCRLPNEKKENWENLSGEVKTYYINKNKE